MPDLEPADLSVASLEEEDLAFVDEVLAPASELANLSELLLLLLPAPLPDDEGELELELNVLLLLLLPKLPPLADAPGLLDESPD